jgi:hypothetical protein
MSESKKGGLVIADRPQISVELVDSVDVLITVSRISDDFASVETSEVVFPAECAKQVARAINKLVRR